jgi:ribonuclease HII
VIPTLERERELLERGFEFIISLDEVGRGAIAGPVMVGAAVFDQTLGAAPEGIKDSKLVSEKKRPVIAEAIKEWLDTWAVGQASAQDVDRYGITHALGRAAVRAVADIAAVRDISKAVVLLDGHHDWLSPVMAEPIAVVTQVKADRDCLSVAASSLLAKVTRDQIMIGADDEFPGYGFAGHKGYGAKTHFEAIEKLGPCSLHRVTWLKAPTLPIDEG